MRTRVLAADGHRGAWLASTNTPSRSVYLHWTGRRWVERQGPFRQDGATVSVTSLAQVPGSSLVWSSGTVSRPEHPIIERLTG